MPSDPATGLPFALLPVDIVKGDRFDGEINYHHHFYNRRHPDLEGTYRLTPEQLANPEDIPFPIIAGFAVRISRGQLLPMHLHNLAHRRYPEGPMLPHTVDEKFRTAVLACSGVVSRWALDVTASPSKRLVYMDDEAYARIGSPKALCTERVYHDKPANHRRRILGNFFMRYAVKQDLSHISSRSIDEFLHTEDDKQRRAIGNHILREAMRASIEPVVPVYENLKKQGLVHPSRPNVAATVWKAVHPDRREKVFRVLRKRLLEVA